MLVPGLRRFLSLQFGRCGKILTRFRGQGPARAAYLLPRSRWCQRRGGQLLPEPPLQVLPLGVHLDFAAASHRVDPARSVVSPRRAEQLVDDEILLRRPAPHGQMDATPRERGANPDTRGIDRLHKECRSLARVRPRRGLSIAAVTTPDLEDDPTWRKLGNATPIASRSDGRNERPHMVLLGRLRNAVVRTRRTLVVAMTREIERKGHCSDRTAERRPITRVRAVIRPGIKTKIEPRASAITRSRQSATSTRALPGVHPPAVRPSPTLLQLGRRGKILKRFRGQGTVRAGHSLPRPRWCQRRGGQLLPEPPLQVLPLGVHLDFAAASHRVDPARSVVSPRRAEQLVDDEILLRRPAPHGQMDATPRERGANPDTRGIDRLHKECRSLARVRPRRGLSIAAVTTPDLEDDPTWRKLGNATPIASRSDGRNERPHMVLL